MRNNGEKKQWNRVLKVVMGKGVGVEIYLEFYSQRKCISKAKANKDILRHKAIRIQQPPTHTTQEVFKDVFKVEGK